MAVAFIVVLGVVFLWDFFTVPAVLRDLPSRCPDCGKELACWQYHSRKECLVHRVMDS